MPPRPMPAAALLLTALAAGPAVADATDVFLVRRADGRVVVERRDALPPPAARGLLIWTDDGRERHAALTTDDSLAKATAPAVPPASTVAYARGSRGEPSAGGPGSFAGTLSLPPANLTDVPRGAAFLTPVENGRVLADRPVVRRVDPKPAAVVVLRDATNHEVARLPFAAGQTAAPVPTPLPPGKYTLRLLDSPLEAEAFTVVSPADRAAVLGRADDLKPLVPAAVAAFVRAEALVGRATADAAPEFLGDLLDAVEAVPEADRSPYLRGQLARATAWAAALSQGSGAKPVIAAAGPAEPSTGVPAADAARAALRAGRVKDAAAALAATPADPRAAGLVTLYQAMVAGEAGAARADEADDLFRQSTQALTAPADAHRAHVNYGHFLHRQAQDRLNNHAAQMAAGVDRPVTAALRAWADAEAEYALALTAAPTPADRAAVRVDQAKLFALLADLVTTLRGPDDLYQAAVEAGSAAAADAAGADPLTAAGAAELRAHLALRADKPADARRLAGEAVTAAAAAGFLPGVEGAYRILGQAAADPAAARRDLTAAHLLGEVLRDRLPAEQTGTTQAGFFARRAYVLDALVELELEAGNPAAALGYAELAKARALQDVLQTQTTTRSRPLAALLADWPKDVAAVEYFFGRKQAHVFVVAPGGAVTAFRLPGEPADLLARVQTFLRGLEGYAPKMLNRYLAGRGFDNAWHTTLVELSRDLLPPAALAEVKSAKTLVVVPQHLLHYFPFPALATAADPNPLDPKRVARPRYLADEEFALVTVPSLGAWDALRRRTPNGPVLAEANAVGLVQAPGEAALPGVETDLANLKGAFGNRLRAVLDGDRATARQARGLLAKPGLLMVATHGFNEADHPLDSFLVLLPEAEGGDGKLRARDVYATRVATDVVVMSACYTGLGDRSPLPGDDLFGLQRAFLHAGARSVLAGLWDVYDGTAPELMGDTLTRLAAGEPVGRAVSATRREFLRKYTATGKPEPYLHPVLLGGVQPAGRRPPAVRPGPLTSVADSCPPRPPRVLDP